MDQKLLFLINRDWTSPLLDRVMTVASCTAFWIVPIALALIAVLAMGGFRARAFVVVAIAAVALTDGVAGKGVKNIVGRLRPHAQVAGVRQLALTPPAWKGAFLPVQETISRGDSQEATGRSFPSNHSANNACVALLAAVFFRRLGWLAFFPALLVAYSRIYTGAHWPSDVLGGIFLGLGVALLTLAFAEWLWRRFATRRFPVLAARHPSLLSAA